MRKFMIFTAISAISATTVMAEPVMLTDKEMDEVVAGFVILPNTLNKRIFGGDGTCVNVCNQGQPDQTHPSLGTQGATGPWNAHGQGENHPIQF